MSSQTHQIPGKQTAPRSSATKKAPVPKNEDLSHDVRIQEELSPLDARLTPAGVHYLQRTIGNRAVGQIIQAKLKIGKPGDKYEQEADRVAEMVMSMPEPAVRRQPEDEEEIQSKPVAEQITPLVQRQVEEEEETAQMEPMIQRQEEEEEIQPQAEEEKEEPVQAKPVIQRQEEEELQMQAEEEELQSKNEISLLHRQELEEEETVQPETVIQSPVNQDQEETVQGKFITNIVPQLQRQVEEDEENIQPKIQTAKLPIQKKENVAPHINRGVENRLSSSKGNGNALSENVRTSMESRFGVDFSQVRVHTDSSAVQMNKELNAQAFTTGKDIYFGEGKYNPQTGGGKRLIAHELVHVVQQSVGKNRIQRQEECSIEDSSEIRICEPPQNYYEPTEEVCEIPDIEIEEQTCKLPIKKKIDKVGIVNWDKSPSLRLRSEPDTNNPDNIIGYLPFNTKVQITEELEGDWYKVSTLDGLVGYAAKSYIWINLPEPNVTLHRVKSGAAGYAINIAGQYYGWDFVWGRDARFYVAVLAFINNIKIPDRRDGWKETHFQANDMIWIPSPKFAKSLVGKLQSGSISYDILDTIGLAGFIQSIDQKIRDYKRAVVLSKDYLAEAISRHAKEGLISGLVSLGLLIIGAIAILAVTTAIGAAIGALLGGLGAALGAKIGFEIGLLIIKWIGIGFLVKYIIDSVIKIGGAFWEFIKTVWSADGDRATIERGARAFAEAIGTVIGILVEALVIFAAAKGLGFLIGKIGGTKFGEKIGITKLTKFLREQLEGAKAREKIAKEKLGGKKSKSLVEWSSGEPLPNYENAVIDSAKFEKYSMDPTNPRNNGKWQAFEEIGYEIHKPSSRKSSTENVIIQLKSKLMDNPAIRGKSTPHGERFEVRVEITGPNGKKGTLVNVWQFDVGKTHPRLITNWLEVHK